MAKISARPFRLALCQLGGTGKVKSHNIELARKIVAQAANSTPKPDLIVLPEIWNSPYAVTSFREYSEKIPEVGSTGSDADSEGEGETIKALREMAREAGCWLIGGECARWGEAASPGEALARGGKAVTDRLFRTSSVVVVRHNRADA
jgi:omega-amidase